nr:MAG TPA: hypothetical protein [Caudoviricetes sp.]
MQLYPCLLRDTVTLKFLSSFILVIVYLVLMFL